MFISTYRVQVASIKALGGIGGLKNPNTDGQNGGAGGDGRIRFDLPGGSVQPSTLPPVGYLGDVLLSSFGVYYFDTDGDGLDDMQEFTHHCDPTNADTDGDGLPDAWEVQNQEHGLSPTNALGALTSPPGDLLTFLQKYQYGLKASTNDSDGDGLTDYVEVFNYHSNPLTNRTVGDSLSDGEKVRADQDPTFIGTRYYYDKNDRLLGAEHAKGLSLGYQYDGNGNIVRQAYLGYNQSTNGLPALWKFINGLSVTDSTGTNAAYADADGDGWSNYQEWRGGSRPLDTNSMPADAPQTAPITSLLPTNTVGAWAAIPMQLWDAEGNASVPFLQYSNATTRAWSNATIVQVDGMSYSTSLHVPALPGGAAHVLVWNALQDLGSLRTNVFLRAQAKDVTLLGNWSPQVSYQVDTLDSNTNGIPDSWEAHYSLPIFGPIDFDLDGFSNYAEYIADTNPTNAASYLRITGLSCEAESLKIEWMGGILATQYLQQLDDLGTNFWQNIATSYPPTPIIGSFTNAIGTNRMQFYRMKATR
jgi:YD repeat-containing protein